MTGARALLLNVRRYAVQNKSVRVVKFTKRHNKQLTGRIFRASVWVDLVQKAIAGVRFGDNWCGLGFANVLGFYPGAALGAFVIVISSAGILRGAFWRETSTTAYRHYTSKRHTHFPYITPCNCCLKSV